VDGLPRALWVLAIDYVFAALIWTLLGRFLLGLFVPDGWDNYIWRFFRRLTDPVLGLVARVTPSFMVDALLPLVAVWWLIVFRVGFNVVADPVYRANLLLVLHLMGLVPASWVGAGG
jgi:uncharacterized protein YggT (Ycf19 family)